MLLSILISDKLIIDFSLKNWNLQGLQEVVEEDTGSELLQGEVWRRLRKPAELKQRKNQKLKFSIERV